MCVHLIGERAPQKRSSGHIHTPARSRCATSTALTLGTIDLESVFSAAEAQAELANRADLVSTTGGEEFHCSGLAESATERAIRSLLHTEAPSHGQQQDPFLEKVRSHFLQREVSTDLEEKLDTKSYLFDDRDLVVCSVGDTGWLDAECAVGILFRLAEALGRLRVPRMQGEAHASGPVAPCKHGPFRTLARPQNSSFHGHARPPDGRFRVTWEARHISSSSSVDSYSER